MINRWENGSYPRGPLEVRAGNRATLVSWLLLVISLGCWGKSVVDGDYDAERISMTSFLVGSFLNGYTFNGKTTKITYKRTINLYRKYGKIPTRFGKALEGVYCKYRGYQMAVEDIKEDRVN